MDHAPVTGPSVDLTADVGEYEDVTTSVDVALMDSVTSVHVACGFHAGGPDVMRRTVDLAVSAGVVLGAHPSYPDREGFGRRDLPLRAAEVADQVLYQVGALDALAHTAGTQVRSVKPHGALYHRVATDLEAVAAICEALRAYSPELCLVLPAGSPALEVAGDAGMTAAGEGFCDRGYLPDGRLVPRRAAGALITDPEQAARQSLSLALQRRVRAVDGTVVGVEADALCVHSDTPAAGPLAARIRRALLGAGVAVAPFAAPPP